MKKPNKTPFVDKLIIPLAILFAIGLVCGSLAGYFDPVDHILIAFAGLAYPFLLLGNVIFVFWWLIRKRWVFSLITVIIIGTGWPTLTATYGLFGDEGKEVKSDPSLIRMMTYNVHSFKPYGEEITKEVKDKILSVVKGQNPDVICFQEFFTRFKGPFNTVDSLKKILNTKYYYFAPKMKSTTEATGFAIFSKFPIENKGEIIFENSFGNGSVFADIRMQGKLIRIYNIHLQSISFEKEDYSYLDKVKDMNTEMAPSRRILHMLKTAFEKRSLQVELMRDHMRSCTTPYIIAGDFNDTPASYAVNKMTDSLHNAFVKKGSGFGKTYNGKFPNFQIDYIGTTKDIEVDNYHIVNAKLSDHFPVRSDLRLKTDTGK